MRRFLAQIGVKMAKGKISGFINRLIAGSEKSEGYARASLPSNRWELFWDILKGRFFKLVLLNLLMVLFFIPLFALLYFRMNGLTNMGALYAFNQPFGVGYGAPLSLVGYAEAVTFDINLMIYLFMPLALFIAAIGVAGGAYVMRNMVWTEGIFVANDFWHGIKKNFKQMAVIALLYSVVFYVSILGISVCDSLIATRLDLKWLFIVCKIITMIVLAMYTIMTFHMITMSVTYELKFSGLFKNAFLFTIGMPFHNVFFMAVGGIALWLTFFGDFLMTLGLGLLIAIGLSFWLLVWTDFCQWAYDRFINDKIKGAKKNRGIYEKVKGSNSEALKKYREQLEMSEATTLSRRPIKPITDDELKIEELPAAYSREDIERLNASRQAIIDDHNRYVEEHKAEYPNLDAEKPLTDEEKERAKRIEKAKKELAKRKPN